MGVQAKSAAMRDLLDEGAGGERVATGFTFTEGPIWVKEGGYLLFSDMPGDVRRKWSPEGGVVEVMRPANKCNGMTLEADGSLLVCEHATSTVVRARLNADGTEASREVIASHYAGKELNSPNDVIVGPDGSIYFSDPWYGRMPVFGEERERELDICGVYRIPPGGGDLELLLDDFDMPNGLCFSPDRSIFYVNDTPRAHIRAFDVQSDGSLASGRLFFAGIGTGEIAGGIPDGMKCDERGNIWVTGPQGVWVVSPAGEHLGIVEVPEHTGNLTWGGAGWRDLYVPSSTSLYRIRTKVASDRQVYH
jgi:gluconolactonase